MSETGVRKQFSPTLHRNHDNQTKQQVIERLPFLLAMLDPKRFAGSSIQENSDKYGVDLIVSTLAGEQVYVEVEHKLDSRWGSPQFPFSTVDIPGRKKKFCELSKPTIFVVLNHDMSQAAIITARTVRESPQKAKKNMYVGAGEEFFQIDTKKCLFVPLMWEEKIE